MSLNRKCPQMPVLAKMTYDEAIGFFHSRNRFGIKPGLENITKLMSRLGNPQAGLKFVHIAGTNGKGSICTGLSYILKSAGYKTGLYISPYIIDFRERIQIDNSMIPHEDLCRVTEKIAKEISKLDSEGVTITEFEAVTAAAFLYFAQEKCDYIVLETGLGGRFDATNIITPVVSIIASISLDHTGILGDTIEKIVAEKCGIIKAGIPVVTNSRQHPNAMPVIRETANLSESRLIVADTDSSTIIHSGLSGTEFLYKGGIYNVPFPGKHQVENFVTVIETAMYLGIEPKFIRQGISDSRNPARTEIVCNNPLVILDGSHNPGSTKALADVLSENLSGKKILAVIGMMADKDIPVALSELLPIFTDVICVGCSNPRVMPPTELANIISTISTIKPIYTADNPCDGVKFALQQTGYDAVVICGSLYLCSDVRPIFFERNKL